MTTPSETRAGKLPDARFGHHPDPAIDFEIEVQSLEARLYDARRGISKMGTESEPVTVVRAAIQKAMEFRVGGVESCVQAKATLRKLEALAASEPVEAEPVPMILHCPRCHVQHVDEPDERTPDWANPPHRSHLCHGCGYIWRPADVATVGVAAIKTKGKADSPAPEQPGKGECQHRWMGQSGGWKTRLCEICGFKELLPEEQPSDPAEGDWYSRIPEESRWTCDIIDGGLCQDRDGPWVHRSDVNAVLSTPPTAAVRVDTNDILFVGFDKNMEKRLFHLRDTAERHCIGDIKTYAALDPQVKR